MEWAYANDGLKNELSFNSLFSLPIINSFFKIMGNSCAALDKMDIKSAVKIGEGNLKTFTFVKHLKGNKFSNVWVVYSDQSKTLRAVKATDKFRIYKERCKDLPINEQKILLQLHHPFLVNIISAFQDEQKLYLVLQYMPYGSLRDYINSQGLLSESNTCFTAKCIFVALKYLHSKGIAHFDIKPENILIDKKKYFRLCDFNLSQQISSINTNSKTIGTVGYKPPQNFDKNVKVGFEADFYSAGVVLYELLTGNSIPIPCGIDSIEITQNLLKVPNISRNCVDFISRLLEKNPSVRLGGKGISQIFEHPWISMSKEEEKKFRQKVEPSFISDQFASKQKTLEQFLEKRRVHNPLENNSDDDDELLKSVYVRNPRFQKEFVKFKTVYQYTDQK